MMYPTEFLPSTFYDLDGVYEPQGKKSVHKVLIIEDDEMTYHQLSHFLKSHNQNIVPVHVERVEEAKVALNGEDAFDLIICDQFLPGTDTGLGLWRHCKYRYPNLPFVMTSGANLNSFFDTPELEAAPLFLQKPFSDTDVWEKVGDFIEDSERVDLTNTISHNNAIVTSLLSVTLIAYVALLYKIDMQPTKQNLIRPKVEIEIPPIRMQEFIVPPPKPSHLKKSTIDTGTSTEVRLSQINVVAKRILDNADQILVEAKNVQTP